MKKFLIVPILLALMLTACKTGAEGAKPADSDSASVIEEESLGFEDIQGTYLFTSGAGGWATVLTLGSDGSFTGDYKDSELGLSGVDYDGTVFFNTFSGQISELTPIDDSSYSSGVESLISDVLPGEEYIEDSIRYVYEEPYGIKEGCKLTVFNAGTNVSALPEEFIAWAKSEYYFEGETLPVTGLMMEVEGEIYGWMLQED